MIGLESAVYLNNAGANAQTDNQSKDFVHEEAFPG
jgi:hypothetical protein